MNKQFGILYTCTSILALTLLLSGCSPAPTPTPVPTVAPTLPPAATATKAATPTVVPTVAPTLPPTATATKAATPTVVPTTAPTLPPTATATKAATPTVVPTTAPTRPPTATAAAATKTAGSSTDTCLACHGPFDKLITASANYLWPNGDKKSPHQYVPHKSKDIPECIKCHKPHPLPPTASDIAAMAKPDPEWCYSCHHAGVLRCGTCHE